MGLMSRLAALQPKYHTPDNTPRGAGRRAVESFMTANPNVTIRHRAELVGGRGDQAEPGERGPARA
jgi:hypothetical protein